MTEVLLVTVIVIAVLAAGFTEAFFKHVWPLIETHLRRRIDGDETALLRRELAELSARLERLETGQPGERA